MMLYSNIQPQVIIKQQPVRSYIISLSIPSAVNIWFNCIGRVKFYLNTTLTIATGFLSLILISSNNLNLVGYRFLFFWISLLIKLCWQRLFNAFHLLRKNDKGDLYTLVLYKLLQNLLELSIKAFKPIFWESQKKLATDTANHVLHLNYDVVRFTLI